MNGRPTAAAAGKIDVGGDLTVNRLGFGAMRITGPGIWGEPPDRDRAKEVLRRAVELGRQLHRHRGLVRAGGQRAADRRGAVPVSGGAGHRDQGRARAAGPGAVACPTAGRSTCARACEGSLARLRLDRIDLYQFHRPDPKVPIAESIGALAELKAEGKIRHIGVSNVTEEQLRRPSESTAIVSVQNRYNVVDRSSEPILDVCDQEMLVFLPWAPIEETGAVPALMAAARRRGVSERQVALAWLLTRSPQVLPIPGSSNPAHVEENVAAASIELTAEEIRAITLAVAV